MSLILFGQTKKSNDMVLKLYKQIDGNLLYWETWNIDNKKGIVHWGVVGDIGQHKEIVATGIFSNFQKFIQKEIDEKKKEGYAEIGVDKQIFLDVEYKIDGFGSEQDLNKRIAIENYLKEVLGWTGLGDVDGGSIGSGTMEIGCVVVNFEIAKTVIEQNLKQSPYSDFSRIYRLDGK